MLRPINPKKFFLGNGIKFKKFHSNMTNGALITFKDNKSLKKQFKKIKKINILGYKLFNISIVNTTQLFCRLQIRSKINFGLSSFNKEIIKRNIFYEKKDSKIKFSINENIKQFLENISFIKTTGKHISDGELFYQNLNIDKKRIENIKINNIIKDYF